MTITSTARPSGLRTAVAALRRRLPELIAFGSVGALAYVVDLGLFNLLRVTALPDSVLTAKIISTVVSIVVAWLGSRYLTFRNQRGGHPLLREIVLFGLSNAAGLGIAVGCLLVSHYLMGLRNPIADNISGNVIGVGLGTIVRYLAYRYLVFRARPDALTPDTVAQAMTPPAMTGRTMTGGIEVVR